MSRNANPTLRHPGARQGSARVLLRGHAERPAGSPSGINQSWVPAFAGMTAVGGEMVCLTA
jgi:hypothetical protein